MAVVGSLSEHMWSVESAVGRVRRPGRATVLALRGASALLATSDWSWNPALALRQVAEAADRRLQSAVQHDTELARQFLPLRRALPRAQARFVR